MSLNSCCPLNQSSAEFVVSLEDVRDHEVKGISFELSPLKSCQATANQIDAPAFEPCDEKELSVPQMMVLWSW